MADIARILSQVIVEIDGAVASFKQVAVAGTSAFKQIATAAQQSTARMNVAIATTQARLNSLSETAKKVGAGMRSVGAGMTAGITLPLVLGARAATQAWNESQVSVANLDNAVQNFGKTAGVNKQEMLDYSAQVQQTFAVSDEAMNDAQASLLRFGNIQGEVFTDARDLLPGFARLAGQEVPDAAKLLGKALADPSRGMMLLRRSGIILTDEQEVLIKTLDATGQEAEAQGALIDALTPKVAGLAEAYAATAEGQEAIEKNKLSDALEVLGKQLVPIRLLFLETITAIAEAFTALPEGLQRFIVIAATILAVVGPVIVVLGSLVTAFGGLISVISFIMPLFAGLGPVFLALGSAIGFILNIIMAVGTALAAVATWPVIIAVAVAAIALLIYAYWDQIVAATTAFVKSLGDILVNAWKGFTQVVRIGVQLWKDAFNLFIVAIKAGFNALWGWIKSGLDKTLGFLGRLVDKAKEAWSWLKKVFAQQKKNESSAGGGGFARGGRVRGRAGIDTIPAWLTNNEFVMRAAAVRRYGVAFMNAVNQGRLGFAAGGLVGAPRMGFAGEPGTGIDSRRAPFTLVVGGQEFAGLTAPTDVADAMFRFARQRQIRSSGAAPQWYK